MRVEHSDDDRGPVGPEVELLLVWRSACIGYVVVHGTSALEDGGEARVSEHGCVESVPVVIHEGVNHVSRSQVQTSNRYGASNSRLVVVVQTGPRNYGQVLIIAVVAIPLRDLYAVGETGTAFRIIGDYLEGRIRVERLYDAREGAPHKS